MALAREKCIVYVIAAVAMLHTASALLHGSTGACRTRPRAAADAELFMGSGAAVAPSELPSAAHRGRGARARHDSPLRAVRLHHGRMPREKGEARGAPVAPHPT